MRGGTSKGLFFKLQDLPLHDKPCPRQNGVSYTVMLMAWDTIQVAVTHHCRSSAGGKVGTNLMLICSRRGGSEGSEYRAGSFTSNPY